MQHELQRDTLVFIYTAYFMSQLVSFDRYWSAGWWGSGACAVCRRRFMSVYTPVPRHYGLVESLSLPRCVCSTPVWC